MQTEQQAELLSDEVGEQESKPSAGEILLQARLIRGFSEKEVADRLHITMHYVKALEADRYEKLPGAVFAKGYIKSYALILDLDPEMVLERYTEFTNQALEQEASRQRVRRRRDKNRPWVIVSVVVFIGGFAGLWAYNSFFADIDTDSSTTPLVDARDIQDLGVAATPARIAAQPAVAETVVIQPPTQAISSPAIEPEASPDLPTALSILAEDARSVPAQTATDTPDMKAATTDTLPAEEVGNEPAQRLIEIGAAGEDVLQISFSDESFIEVNDRLDNRIHRGVQRKGDIVQITGSAPFTILLGDAPFTRLTFNGTEIDVSDDIRIDNSARLTVGL
ncbi:MAG: DUF4115 domain-containing protein [Proteobacteria bacterium]|nr:DUF4115 domain-containing protein [Pseudomonadota bacterium]